MVTPSPRPPAERGQSLVEFSLMAVFLLVVLAGILDLGRVYYTLLALKDAAAEGASYAQGNPTKWCSSTSQSTSCASFPSYAASADPNNIIYRIKNSAPTGGMVNWTNATITITPPATIAPGQMITVTVRYQYQLLTPFIGAIAGGQILNLSTSSTSVIVSPP